MRRKTSFSSVMACFLCLVLSAFTSAQKRTPAPVGGNLLPDGFYITPTAAPGSVFQGLPTGLRPDGSADANGAVNTALSPDGTALLILTTGYNTNFNTQAPDGTPILWAALYPLTGLPSSTMTPNAEWVFLFGHPRRAAGAEATDQHPQHLSGIVVGSPRARDSTWPEALTIESRFTSRQPPEPVLTEPMYPMLRSFS